MRDPALVALTCARARAHGLVEWEFLGGMFAEGFRADAERPASSADWRRYWEPPEPRFDVSFGLGQRNVRYSDEYAAWCWARGIPFASPGPADAYPGDDCIAQIRAAYLDPVHALDVAAEGYHKWRYDPEVEPLHAWVAYNGPVYYRGWTRANGTVVTWRDSPNLANYRDSLAEARALLGVDTVISSERVVFRPQEPPHRQEHSYDCSQDAGEWALWSLGRHPEDGWMEAQMVADGVMSRADGLLDATGRTYARWLQAQYGEFGFLANSEDSVSFDWAAQEGGHIYPILIGGRAWNHWSGVWGYDPASDRLLLANPSPGWKGIDQTMSRQQFAALGPFSAIRLWHPDLLVPEPAPQPVPSPLPDTPVPPEPVPPPPLPVPSPRPSLDEVLAELDRITTPSDDANSARWLRGQLAALVERLR